MGAYENSQSEWIKQAFTKGKQKRGWTFHEDYLVVDDPEGLDFFYVLGKKNRDLAVI